MPNHVKNRLVIFGTNDQVEEVFKKYNTHLEAQLSLTHNGDIVCFKEDGSVGWFNKSTGIFTTRENRDGVIGLPDGYKFRISPAKDIFPDFDKIIPHPRCDEYNDLPSQSVARNSPNWWMTWNRKYWGTKWGGYSYEQLKFGAYTFETAWNGVPDLMLELSKQNPELEFEYTYSDEDSGYNVGKYQFKAGEVLMALEPDGGTKEAYDICFELKPYEKEYYKLVGETYEYIDEE